MDRTIRVEKDPAMTIAERTSLNFAAGLVVFRLIELAKNHRRRSVRSEPTLTAREHAVLYAYSQGKRADEIARMLEIADNTVDTFLKRAEKKLNAKTPAHAVAKAMRAMLIG
jgi:LuxR family transcriptional regulator, transcriptional regulator of spore coat protein